MTLILNAESAEAIERSYRELANELQERLDALTFRAAEIVGVLHHGIKTADHGTAKIEDAEQEVWREQARQLVLGAEALAEAVWEVTGEINEPPLSDARVLEAAPRHKAAIEAIAMEREFRLRGGQDVTADLDQLTPDRRCPIMELKPTGFLRCVLPNGHSLGDDATEHLYQADVPNEASLADIQRIYAADMGGVEDVVDAEVVEPDQLPPGDG